MPLTQASAGASCAGRKRPHDGAEAADGAGHARSAAGGSPASGGKRQQPAAGGDSRAPAAATSVEQSAASAAVPQQENQPPAEQERDQQGAAPPATAQAGDDEQPAPETELPPPPPKLKPRRPFAPRSFYSHKAPSSGSKADGGGGEGGGGGKGGGSTQPSRAPTPRELYLETQVHRLLLAAKAREASWKAAEAQHGPGAQPPPEVFETFPTQQPAFERADSLGLDVFSGEQKRVRLALSRCCWQACCIWHACVAVGPLALSPAVSPSAPQLPLQALPLPCPGCSRVWAGGQAALHCGQPHPLLAALQVGAIGVIAAGLPGSARLLQTAACAEWQEYDCLGTAEQLVVLQCAAACGRHMTQPGCSRPVRSVHAPRSSTTCPVNRPVATLAAALCSGTTTRSSVRGRPATCTLVSMDGCAVRAAGHP